MWYWTDTLVRLSYFYSATFHFCIVFGFDKELYQKTLLEYKYHKKNKSAFNFVSLKASILFFNFASVLELPEIVLLQPQKQFQLPMQSMA